MQLYVAIQHKRITLQRWYKTREIVRNHQYLTIYGWQDETTELSLWCEHQHLHLHIFVWH